MIGRNRGGIGDASRSNTSSIALTASMTISQIRRLILNSNIIARLLLIRTTLNNCWTTTETCFTFGPEIVSIYHNGVREARVGTALSTAIGRENRGMTRSRSVFATAAYP